MNPRLIDTHSHIHLPPYDQDRAAVLGRMKSEKVWTLAVGTSARSSEIAIQLAEKTEGVWATVAYQPEHLTSSYFDPSEGEVEEYSAEEIARVARSSKKVVAIGEAGLDFFRFDEGRDVDESKKLQIKVFREHIDLARELNLPLAIHCRKAMSELIEILRDEKSKGPLRGVVHFFTGTWDEAEKILDLGFFLGFNGAITFPVKKTQDPETHVHRVIERMPMDRILLETDAPWLAPQAHRGERNEPTYVKFVAEKIAELRGMDVESVAEQTTKNAIGLFGLDV